MAQFVKSLMNGNNNPDVDYFYVAASQTIKQGDIVQVDATTKLLEVAEAASTTIVGIANADITTAAGETNKQLPVVLVRDVIIRMAFTNAGTKKTFTQADKYVTKFDISNQTTVNPDDTTGGMMQVYAYDNEKLTVDVVVSQANQIFN
ncbi:hypothetical protein B2I21_35135 [Chryseobacterium mucoviscidosis]|nr:hypothetical protein B2I21_35135 [Chryseobacterium mucoviscidosis]